MIALYASSGNASDSGGIAILLAIAAIALIVALSGNDKDYD